MNIKALINGIIDLDKENTALKNKVKKYEEGEVKKNEESEVNVAPSIIDKIKDEIFLLGLEKTLNDFWNNPFNYLEEVFNKDTRSFITFQSWLESVTIDEYYRKNFPKSIKENLSNREIIRLYVPYLFKKYKELVEAKKVELMQEGKEQKAKEEVKEDD